MTSQEAQLVLAAIFAVLLAVLVGVVVWLTHPSRRPSGDGPTGSNRRPRLSPRILIGLGVGALALLTIAIWAALAGNGHEELVMPMLLIGGIVTFLAALGAIVLLYVRNGLSNREYALGLPDGSIRAIIALSLILLFAILSVFLFLGTGAIGGIQPTAAQADLAKQLVTTMSTLVVAISSFYFGSTTVREARKDQNKAPEIPDMNSSEMGPAGDVT